MLGASAEPYDPARPVAIIYDTDIGNDVDDALALGVIHALQSRGECELLAVTSAAEPPGAFGENEPWVAPHGID